MGSTRPSTTQYFGGVTLKDMNGDSIRYDETAKTTAGVLYRSFCLRRCDINGENPALNGFYLRINDDGTKEVSVTDPQAWQEGLGVLPLTGGTVTGTIIRKWNTVDNKATNNGVSSTVWNDAIVINDKNNLRTAFFGNAFYSNGNVTTGIYVYNHDTSGNQSGTNYLTIGVTKDGTKTYSVADSAIFWSAIGGKALGKKDTATLPIKVIEASSAAYNTAVAAGNNFQINIDIPAETNYIVVAPVAIYISSGNNTNGMSLRGFDVDGLSTSTAVRIKTYWHTQTAIAANSAIVIGSQAFYAAVSKVG